MDARSDIFSFGSLLYEMLTGHLAFRRDSAAATLAAIARDEPQPVTTLVDDVSPRLGSAIGRCLRKDPNERFRGMAEVGAELKQVLEELTSVRQREPNAILQERKSTKGRLKLPWSAGAAALLAVGIVGWLLWPGSRTEQPLRVAEPVFRRVTNDPGLTSGAAISADGKLIAYASDKGNSTNLDIWVQQVDGRGLVRVTEDPADDHDPVFSADGTQVLFRSERHEPGIYTAPAIGGEARLVVPEGRRPRVSPDGQSLMYWTGPDLPRDVRGSSDVKLWVKPLSGGEAIHIAAGCRLFEQTPVWAPDGSRILFVGACGSDLARGSLPENYGVTAWVSTVEGKGLEANRELYQLWHSIHQPPIIDQWLANPSRLLIPLPRGDATSITVVPVSVDGTRVSGPPQILTFAGGNVTRISAALNRMALSAETLERRIWALPTDVKGAARGAPKQLTHGPAGEWSPSLSADGQKLSFLSLRANGARLFYKDLSTGREKEVSTEGYRYDTPMLNRAGTKILCVQYPSPSSWRDFVFEVPVSGGLSRKVWDRSTFSWLWDWSPDEATLLFHNTNTGTKSSEDWDVRALDLKSSLSRTLLLAAPERLSDAHFSHDGRRVAFEATPMMVFAAKPSSSRVYVAPFRDTSVPRSEWITVTGGTSDYSPRFTFDDSSVLFASDRDGFRCIWAQALGPDMHPNGSPIAIYHSHERRRPLGNSTAYFNWGVGPHSIVFDRTDSSGNVLLLESAGVRTK